MAKHEENTVTLKKTRHHTPTFRVLVNGQHIGHVIEQSKSWAYTLNTVLGRSYLAARADTREMAIQKLIAAYAEAEDWAKDNFIIDFADETK